MFSLAVEDSPRLKRDSETVPTNRTLRIELHGPARKHLCIRITLRVVAAGALLHQHYAQRYVRVGISRRPGSRIAIRGFRVFPALLIGVYVTQTIRGASVAGFQFQYFLVRGFGFGEPARIASLVTLFEQFFDAFGNGWFHARAAGGPVSWFWCGRTRLGGGLLFGLRVLCSEYRPANIHAHVLRERL